MDIGTRHILAVARQRPVLDVATEWLSHTRAVHAHEEAGPALASRDEAYQQLALDHFASRFDVDPGVTGDAVEKVHAALAPSLDAAPSRDADALLDCMAGWYLTADGRYRKAVADALGREGG